MNMDAAAVRLLAIFFHRFMLSSPFVVLVVLVVIALCASRRLMRPHSGLLQFHSRRVPCTHTHTRSSNGYADCAARTHAYWKPKTNTILFSICFLNWFAFSILVGILFLLLLFCHLCFGFCVMRWLRSDVFFMVIARGATAIKVYIRTHTIHITLIAHNQTSNERNVHISEIVWSAITYCVASTDSKRYAELKRTPSMTLSSTVSPTYE